jgi:hypothetical protein
VSECPSRMHSKSLAYGGRQTSYTHSYYSLTAASTYLAVIVSVSISRDNIIPCIIALDAQMYDCMFIADVIMYPACSAIDHSLIWGSCEPPCSTITLPALCVQPSRKELHISNFPSPYPQGQLLQISHGALTWLQQIQ